jgi:hypothetical protein
LTLVNPEYPGMSIAQHLNLYSADHDYFSTRSTHSPIGIILINLFTCITTQTHFCSKYSVAHNWAENLFFEERVWAKEGLDTEIIFERAAIDVDPAIEIKVSYLFHQDHFHRYSD